MFLKAITARLVFALLALLIGSMPIGSGAAEKIVIGEIENVAIGKTQTLFVAKIDTGAENSSLHVREMKMYSERGQAWVKFRIKNKYGKNYSFKKKVKRMATIKRKLAPDQLRPVVELDLCIGRVHKKVEVNLVDRSNFKYPFLVGKSFLSGVFLVDVEKSFSLEPQCDTSATRK